MLPNLINERFKQTENTDKVLPETLLGFASVTLLCTLIKKKIKFSSYIRKLRKDRLQSHIRLKASSSYMVKYLRIYSYFGKPFLIYEFATDPISISLYMRKISFSFLSMHDYFCALFPCCSIASVDGPQRRHLQPWSTRTCRTQSSGQTPTEMQA
jgi:hypothetical protein